MKGYAKVMTALSANTLTILIGYMLTDADLIAVVFMGILCAGIAVGVFEIVTGLIEGRALLNARVHTLKNRKIVLMEARRFPDNWLVDEAGRRVEGSEVWEK